LACFGGILTAGSAQTASMNPPESRSAAAPDAWFDHAAGAIIMRKTYRLPGRFGDHLAGTNRRPKTATGRFDAAH